MFVRLSDLSLYTLRALRYAKLGVIIAIIVQYLMYFIFLTAVEHLARSVWGVTLKRVTIPTRSVCSGLTHSVMDKRNEGTAGGLNYLFSYVSLLGAFPYSVPVVSGISVLPAITFTLSMKACRGRLPS